MPELGTVNSFLRRAFQQIPWDAPRFVALFSILSGLVPDTLAEANRTVARLLVPLPESPTDILPYLARALGVPLYPVQNVGTASGYLATLARLQATLASHEVAGAAAQIAAECVQAGLSNPEVIPDTDQTLQAFDIAVDDSTDPEEYGGGAEYGDGTIFGRQVSADRARGLLAVMEYFRPAGARFRELVES